MTEQEKNPVEGKDVKKNKRTLYLILAVAFLPMFLAYFMFYTGIGVPQSTVNAGLLFPTPVSIEEVTELKQSEVFTTEKKWRLFVPVGEACGEICQANLFLTRQVHIRLAQKSERVERVAVSLAGVSSDSYLDEISSEHPKLKNVSVNIDSWNSWLKKSNQDFPKNLEYYLLVDQEGFAMMLYTHEVGGNELLKDLKRVLKFSLDYQS